MGRKPKQPVCDRDCFNCIHPDCICDDMSSEEYKESYARDKEARPVKAGKRAETPEQRESRRARERVWYQANRERILAKKAAYRREHREEVNAKQRAYDRAHPESKRAWRQANKDKVREYQRRAQAKKKALAQGERLTSPF